MITPGQVRNDIRCLRAVRENVESLFLRRHALLAKSLVVMHKANPVVASRLADELKAKPDTELTLIEMQTAAKIGSKA